MQCSLIRYADVKQILFGGGKKKLFGGHDISFLHVYLLNGSTKNFQFYGEFDHLYRVGMLAKSAVDAVRHAEFRRSTVRTPVS